MGSDSTLHETVWGTFLNLVSPRVLFGILETLAIGRAVLNTRDGAKLPHLRSLRALEANPDSLPSSPQEHLDEGKKHLLTHQRGLKRASPLIPESGTRAACSGFWGRVIFRGESLRLEVGMGS